MKSFTVLGAASAAVVAVSMIVGQASANDPKKSGPTTGVLPALAGPIGAAAIVGPNTNTLHWTTTEIVPYTKTFTYTKIINVPTQVNTNTYWIKNIVGKGNPPFVEVSESAYNNVNLSTHIREIRVVTTTVEVPTEVTKTKTVTKYKKVETKHSSKDKSNSSQGKFIVGCIMGSALGGITAAIRKGDAMGNPLRWRSQAEHESIVKSGYEKQFELTNAEAALAVAFCGLGSFALHWQQQAPVAVKAKY
jgi:hypothetical protein